MEVISIFANEPFQVTGESIACIGYFDGVHLGHQQLINKTIAMCDTNCKPAIICFDNDPWIVMNKISDASYITPHKERLAIFEEMGIKTVFLLHFDEAMMHLSKEAFISSILEKMNLKALVCGNDFHFAYRGEGSINDLQNRSFALEVMETVCFEQQKISSSNIEQDILAGRLSQANKTLNKPYAMKGIVVHGNHVGSTKLGFPTANLQIFDPYIIPKKGVYQGQVMVNGKLYDAVINVGNNPTMNYQKNTSIEAHILDFEEDIYGANITFYFLRYLRGEVKFESVKQLIAQLKQDVLQVRENKRV